ncbi:MAG: energy transducer TonB, partial [Muribaculaceae bacterium]|nr:energy transducer TonB [Muribaculaceae bacterium]
HMLDISSTNKSEEVIYIAVEQSAEFPGGLSSLYKWLSQNIRYPEVAQLNDIQGRVVVRFVVEKDGSIGEASIYQGVDKHPDKEALRVVRNMPKWYPAKNSGVPVRSYFMIPINFRLQE